MCSRLKLFVLPFLLILLFFFLLSLTSCASTSSSTPQELTGEYVWPKPPAQPKIKWLAKWSDRNDFGKASQVLEFLVGKERVEKLRRPNGVVADAAGNIYVADSEMRMVICFDIDKKTMRFLGMGSIAGPIGLAIDEKRGIVYVSDSRLNKVFGISKSSGNVTITIGSADEFKNPSGMVFDEERGRLYIADTHHHIIKVFDRDANPLFTIGKRGDADGEFNFPSYLAIDRNGKLYVMDSFNFRVQIFDQDGKFLKKFGKLGDSSGSFSRPHGIGVDSEGHIYVVDSAFNNFQIFDDGGRLLLWVGNSGTKPGQFYLPTGMYIDRQDRIYVADTFNRRIQVFQYMK
jgi:DNA-binding beta-propeller fold protein YncE